MSLRRLASVLSVTVIASASFVAAAPKKDDKKAPLAPAKDPAPAKGPVAAPAAGSAAGGGAGSASAAGSAAGSAVAPIEDTPPADMNGTDENPDAPKGVAADKIGVVAVPKVTHPTSYPVEEALRPITLPANMGEISIAPHFVVSPYAGGDALHARFGITRQVQLGLTYVFAGIYDDPVTMTKKDYGFHAGKAVGLDLTVLVQNWIGVRVGVPVYIDPLAIALAIAVPIKFTFGDKFAIGGLDDLLNIKLKRFAPSFLQEHDNAVAAADIGNTAQSNGHVRVSAYAIWQQKTNVALIGRFGVDNDLGTGGTSAPGVAGSGTTATFLRGGVDWTPRRFFDIGASLGFDDLARAGSFGLGGYLALRI